MVFCRFEFIGMRGMLLIIIFCFFDFLGEFCLLDNWLEIWECLLRIFSLLVFWLSFRVGIRWLGLWYILFGCWLEILGLEVEFVMILVFLLRCRVGIRRLGLWYIVVNCRVGLEVELLSFLIFLVLCSLVFEIIFEYWEYWLYVGENKDYRRVSLVILLVICWYLVVI